MKEKFSPSYSTATQEDAGETSDNDDKVQPYMIMPYAGRQGEKIMSKIVKKMPENVRPKIVYNGTKLSTFFSVKDKVEKEHCSNIVYYYESKRDESIAYTGETKCRLGKRIKEHQGRDKNSAIVIDFSERSTRQINIICTYLKLCSMHFVLRHFQEC